MHQREGIDSGVVVGRVGAEAAQIVVLRFQQHVDAVQRLLPLALRGSVALAPAGLPGILMHPSGEGPGLGIHGMGRQDALGVLQGSIKAVALLSGQGEPLEATALLPQGHEIVRLDGETAIELLDRGAIVLALPQRNPGLDPG